MLFLYTKNNSIRVLLHYDWHLKSRKKSIFYMIYFTVFEVKRANTQRFIFRLLLFDRIVAFTLIYLDCCSVTCVITTCLQSCAVQELRSNLVFIWITLGFLLRNKPYLHQERAQTNSTSTLIGTRVLYLYCAAIDWGRIACSWSL